MARRIAEISIDELRTGLAQRGVVLDLGAARIRVRSDFAALAPLLKILYRDYELEEEDRLCDVTANLRRARGLRRYVRPQVQLVVDGSVEFEPFPADTPIPLLEWGMNYALAKRSCWCLLLHAGVVERGGRAVVLPAMPGAGKSTLTAALASRGFRLLSDEFGVVSFADSSLIPMLRPVALKNESIDVIAKFAPDAVIGPRFPKTHKGTVAHLAPWSAHVAARRRFAAPGLVIFPRFDPSNHVHIEPVTKAQAFAQLALNSFNYEFVGALGFEALGRLMQASSAYRLRYGDLEGAVDTIGALLDQAPEATVH
jgi:HprK-related kinase A